MPKIGFPMLIAKNRFQILNLHPKKHVLKKKVLKEKVTVILFFKLTNKLKQVVNIFGIENTK